MTRATMRMQRAAAAQTRTPRPVPPRAPGSVQSAYAVPQSFDLAVNVAYPGAQAAGPLNVIVIGWNDSIATVRSVTDSAGNTYAIAAVPTVSPGIFTQTIYYAKAITAAQSNTVTVLFDTPALDADIRILEYQGIDTVDPLDVSAGTAASGLVTSAGPIVTSAPDVLIAANTVEQLTSGAGAGFAQQVLTKPDGDIVEDLFASNPGSYTATAPASPAGRWVMQIVAFRVK